MADPIAEAGEKIIAHDVKGLWKVLVVLFVGAIFVVPIIMFAHGLAGRPAAAKGEQTRAWLSRGAKKAKDTVQGATMASGTAVADEPYQGWV